jgi:hypothetical protein
MDIRTALRRMDAPIMMVGQSDNSLVAKVTAIQTTNAKNRMANRLTVHPAKTPTIAAGLDGGGVSVRPIDAMHRLSRVTALTITNDVYAYYRHWGWLRYLGAFEHVGTPSRLALDHAAIAHVHGNQLRVLSEELGVGFGVLLAEEWCRRLGARGAIRTTDVDKALRDPAMVGQLTQAPNARRQPDYLMQFNGSSGTGALQSRFLETKGTASPSYAITQLAHATTQLASLLLNERSLQGVAISTISRGAGVEYLAVDPDGDTSPWVPEEKLIDEVKRRRPRIISREGTLNASRDDFLASATVTANASLADFAGLYDTARTWLPQDPILVTRGDRVSTERSFGDIDFAGTEFQISVPGSRERLTVFQGIERSVEEALNSGRDDRVRQAQERFFLNEGSRLNSTDPNSAETGSMTTAVSDEGAVLRIEVR